MKATIRLIGCLIVLLSLATSCALQEQRQVHNSFYYWKSTFNWKQQDTSRLRQWRVSRLYLKFFDVAWDPERSLPVPVSIIRFAAPFPARVALIPTVFITNNTLLYLPEAKVAVLAQQINRKIQVLHQANQLPPIREVQIDCDWTGSTKAKYFTLLTELNRMLTPQRVELSATIRLHQVKYFDRTGVPPVKRGMLMFYNFTAPNRTDVQNSILDPEVGKQYLDHLARYPLALDVALPLYSWGVVFQDNRFIGIINNLKKAHLTKANGFKPTGGNWYLATRNTEVLATRIYRGDRIRVEESDLRQCRRSARYLAARLWDQPVNVALFHYAPEIIKGVDHAKIQSLFHCFN